VENSRQPAYLHPIKEGIYPIRNQQKGGKMSPTINEQSQDPISNLIYEIRTRKVEVNALNNEIKDIKAELTPLVQTHGNWLDEAGYARIVKRDPGIKCTDTKAIYNQATIWSESDDPTMKAHGQTLLQHFQETEGSQYLSIK